MNRLLRGSAIAALAAGSASGQTWTEVLDAGQDGIDEAQITWGAGLLTSIEGTITTPQDIDIYCIRVTDEANFLAQMSSSFDPAMYLFDVQGNGVVWNDDFGSLQPAIDSTEVTSNGVYFLAVSDLQGIQGPVQFETHARDENGEPIYVFVNQSGQSPATACGSPERPSCNPISGRLAFWETAGSFAGGSGPYSIALTGAEFCAPRCPTTLHVPSSFATIQDALNAAVDGDEIVVAPGTYVEPGLANSGKQVVVRSSHGAKRTILAPGAGATAFLFNPGCGPLAGLEGLTLDGEGTSERGIVVTDSAPIIRDCVVRNFVLGAGPGSWVQGVSNPIYEGVRFTSNTATIVASAVGVLSGSFVRFTNCLFDNNNSADTGALVYEGGVEVLASTFADNSAGSGGSAMNRNIGGTQSGSNNVFFGNTGGVGDFGGFDPNVELASSLFAGGTGTNIPGPPNFLDPSDGDYRLGAGSPAIDAGDCSLLPPDVSFDFDGRDRLLNAVSILDTGPVCSGMGPLDMGCFESSPGTPSACPGDADGNGVVNFNDITTVLSNWLSVCP